MATEMATPISATQNSNTVAKASKTTAKPRTARAKASTSAPAKSPRAKSSRASAKSTQAKAAEVMDASGASIERALLEKESSKSLSASTPKAACKAHCGQCGREMRFVPFSLSNLMCRSCYGLDRYRRPVAPTVVSASAPSNTSS